MQVFAVMDQSFFGRGVFALFSSRVKAEEHRPAIEETEGTPCVIRPCLVIAGEGHVDVLYAGYTYDDIYDVLIFDAIYAKASLARDVVGRKGLVVRLFLDAPGGRESVTSG